MKIRLRHAATALLVAAAAALAACDRTTGPGPGPDPDRQPSSYELIDSALARGSIDAETALLQKLFAATDDARLRDEFRDPTAATRTDLPAMLPIVLRTAAARLPTLSAAGQRVVVGYFQPPAYQGSAWPLAGRASVSATAHASAVRRGPSFTLAAGEDPVPGPAPLPKDGWRYVDAAGIPVRVWALADESGGITPEQVIGILEREVWPKLTAFMQRPPVSDQGTHTVQLADGATVAWGDGGDGRFDIYLVELSGRGHGGAVTINYPPGCSAAPAFMLVDPELKSAPLAPALAHEFFHALQFAFARTVPCDALWDEATAEWASHYVYPRWDPKPDGYMLEFPESELSRRDYEGWIVNAFLEHAHGPELVRATYEQYARHTDAMLALDAALPGGLAALWPEFARHAWNQDPAGRSFQQWEGMSEIPLRKGDAPGPDGQWYQPLAADTIELGGKKQREWSSSNPPGALTRKYRRWGVREEAVRWVQFTNTAAGKPVAVQAYVKIRGKEWRLEDWSKRRTVSFCRDNPAERIDSLVTIMADYTLPNQRWSYPGHAKVEARAACPSAYSIDVTETTVSEKYGKTYDVTYVAVVQTDRSGHEGELVGQGSYFGTIVTHKANCNNGEPDNSQTFAVDGRLDATAGVGPHPDDPEHRQLFSYTLATLDWKFLPFAGRLAETPDELEAARGLGSVGSGLNPLTLVGGAVERTDTLTRSWSDCTGNAFQIRTTRVNYVGSPK